MKTFKTIIALTMVYLMAVFPAMASLTVDNKINISLGNKKMVVAQVDFDDSYAFGGESFDYTAHGFVSVDTVKFIDQKGYTFEYDYTNKKVKVFSPAPAIVYEEKHTLGVGNLVAGTTTQAILHYPAAYIMSIASATANYKMLSSGSTIGSGEIGVNLYATTPGVRAILTANTAQGSEVIYVTYVTQAWKEVFDNLVVDEAKTLSTTETKLSYTAAAIMYIDVAGAGGTGSSTPQRMTTSGDTLVAEECEVDFTQSGVGGTTTVTSQAAGANTKITYIKLPASGFLADRFVEQESSVISSGAGYTNWPVLLWGTAGQILDLYSAATPTCTETAVTMMAGDGLGTGGEGYIDWFRTKTLLGTPVHTAETASTLKASTYIKGVVSEIPGLVPLEVKNTADLSGVTNVRVEIIGN